MEVVDGFSGLDAKSDATSPPARSAGIGSSAPPTLCDSSAVSVHSERGTSVLFFVECPC